MYTFHKFHGLFIAGIAIVAALLLTSGQSAAATGCFTVKGHYIERAVAGPECLSPVGLCIAGTYHGDISGPFRGSATTITPTADTPATSVVAFTSDSTINGSARGNRGTLIVKNAGVFATAPDGSIVDLQTIVGGTGKLAGAQGFIRASGTFSSADGGRSEYEGSVCVR